MSDAELGVRSVQSFACSHGSASTARWRTFSILCPGFNTSDGLFKTGLLLLQVTRTYFSKKKKKRVAASEITERPSNKISMAGNQSRAPGNIDNIIYR